MKVFLDCEFTQLNAQAKLISLALVAEDGRELYVELTDGYELQDCSAFVIEHVLPQLNLAERGCTTVEAQKRLAAFVEALHANLEICSDAPGYDWEFFCELMYVDGKWPVNVLNRPLNLIDMCNELETEGVEIETPELPHHALLDARILAKLYKQIK
jgi:hypothetical protein